MQAHLRFAAILIAGLLFQPTLAAAQLCLTAVAEAAGETQSPCSPRELNAPGGVRLTAAPPLARDAFPNASPNPPPAPHAQALALRVSRDRIAAARTPSSSFHGRLLYLTTQRLRL